MEDYTSDACRTGTTCMSTDVLHIIQQDFQTINATSDFLKHTIGATSCIFRLTFMPASYLQTPSVLPLPFKLTFTATSYLCRPLFNATPYLFQPLFECTSHLYAPTFKGCLYTYRSYQIYLGRLTLYHSKSQMYAPFSGRYVTKIEI